MSYKVWMPRPMYFKTLREAIDCTNDYAKATKYIVAVVESKHKVTHEYKKRSDEYGRKEMVQH